MQMLEVSKVSKKFGSKQVLRNLSFQVPEHSIYGFIGENGAGKTTTMSLILGLLAMDSGEILVNGENVCYGQNRTNRFIGYLPDVPEFYSFMTPEEYLVFCGEITGMQTKESKKRASELLELVGLSQEKKRIRGFSRGMKQRLGIAQALLHRPKLLICDEPTSALDPVGRKELLDILCIAKEQTTVLFSTHILSDVERICDEVALLHNGEIALQGTLDEVKGFSKVTGYEVELCKEEEIKKLLAAFPQGSRLENGSLLFDGMDASAIREVMQYICREEISLQRLERREPALEALFMEVIGK